jgi:hypothetical protein
LHKLRVALAGIAVVIVIGLATPATLVALASFVWPHSWVWHDIGLARCVVLGFLALATVAWLLFVVDFVADVVAQLRSHHNGMTLGAGARVRMVGWVVGLVLLVGPTSLAVGSAAGASTPAAQVTLSVGHPLNALVSSTAAPSTPIAPPGPSSLGGSPIPVDGATAQPLSMTYIVMSGDNLSTIALHFYGDEGAWGEVWAANSDRLMPDGRRFVDPNLIYVGWTLTLPGISESPTVTATKMAIPPPVTPAGPSTVITPTSGPPSSVQPTSVVPRAPIPAPKKANATSTASPTGARVSPSAKGLAAATAPRADGPPVPSVSVPSTAATGQASRTIGIEGGSNPVLPWVPEAAVLGVSAVVAAAIARRLRRGRSKARAGRGDGEAVVEPGADAVLLERLVTPFADAPVLDWLELANRHLTGALRGEDRVDDVPRIPMVRVGAGGVELLLDRTVDWAPGAFTLADNGHTWVLAVDVDRQALSATACGELAWLPLLVPIGDDQNGTYLLHLDPGEVVSIEGPGRQSMMRSWTAALVSWPWAEQVAVTQSLAEAAALAPLYVGQSTPDERGTVFLLGDPSGLTDSARTTIAAVVGGPSVGGRHIVALPDRVVLEPSGIALRPCGLSVEHEGAVQCALDERSLIPVATSHSLDIDTDLVEAISGPVEVRLLTLTPELVGLPKRMPNDKTVRITELIAWIALAGDNGTTSTAMIDNGIAGATASKTLYNIISAARNALGTDSSGARRLMRDTSTGIYRLSPEVTVDVLRFEQMARCGVASRDPKIAAQLCDAALSLIDDRPVGNGNGRYGWWASNWEARVGRLAIKAARRLVEVAEEGLVDVEVARHGIERARLAAGGEEELHRVAMELEAWAGNHECVEREWELACAQAEELDPGCAPSDATEALLLTLRGRNARSGHTASG